MIVTKPPRHLGVAVAYDNDADPSLAREAGRGRDQCGQATKGMWGMSRRQEAMKGVEDCDKPGVLVKRELIPGFPNYSGLNP